MLTTRLMAAHITIVASKEIRCVSEEAGGALKCIVHFVQLLKLGCSACCGELGKLHRSKGFEKPRHIICGLQPDRLWGHPGRVQGWESVCWGGTIMFLGNLKDSKNDLPKIPRFHAHTKLFKQIQYFPKNMLGLVWFTYVFGLSTIIQDLLRFHHRIFRFYLTRSDIPIVSDPP